MIHRLTPLLAILSILWILILAGSYIIFQYIAPIPDMLGASGRFYTAVLKLVASGLLVAAWLYIMIRLRDTMVKRKLLSND